MSVSSMELEASSALVSLQMPMSNGKVLETFLAEAAHNSDSLLERLFGLEFIFGNSAL